jgi:hypothetical protein
MSSIIRISFQWLKKPTIGGVNPAADILLFFRFSPESLPSALLGVAVHRHFKLHIAFRVK